MSSIVTSILSSTVGLLWNKARDSTAVKLKDGDVTDAKIREIVVRELNDIKAKLDGLSRKDLLSSYNFLQEGIDLLNVSLDKSEFEKKAMLNAIQHDQGKASKMQSGARSGILRETFELYQAMKKLKNNSEKEFESIRERFKYARIRATDAFSNESLSIKDRVFAAKLRIVSEILEYLDSPETAFTGCLSFLKQLHSLPAIQQIFTVYLNGGVKSMLNKAERVENVKSVMLINGVLFQYVSKFSNKYSFVLAWPTIELADRSFFPILNWSEVAVRKSMGEDLTQYPPNKLLLDEGIDSKHSAVNGHGDIVARAYTDNIKVLSKTGECKTVSFPDNRKGEVTDQYIVGLAIDKNNNVYVVRWLEMENGVGRSHLFVLDENNEVEHDSCTLDFFENPEEFCSLKIAINKNNDIIMMNQHDSHVYVCDHTGKLKHKFEHDSCLLPSLGIFELRDEIMISSGDRKAVNFYTEEGKMTSTIKPPEGHEVRGVVFHYLVCKIIVLTYVKKKDSYFLLCYQAETGELEISTFLCMRKDNENEYPPQITSHPNGAVAVVRLRSITFI